MAHGLSAEERQSYKDAFDQFDRDGNGDITIEELGTVMRSLGQNPTDAELKDIINEVDIDNNGSINFEEFLLLMAPKSTAIDHERELRGAFDVFDKDGSGSISTEELRAVMRSIGENLSDAEIDEMLNEADKDKNGTIDFEEFKAIMK